MEKEKAKDILREAVSYIVGRQVEGLEDFKTEVNDLEDYLLKEFFNR